MKNKKIMLGAMAALMFIGQVSVMFPRGGGGHGGGHGGGGRGGRGGGAHMNRGGGGHAAGRGQAGRGGAGRHDGRGGRGRDGRSGRGYHRGGYGYGHGGWGNGWGWGFWGGALLWTAPLWWSAGMYAPYTGSGNSVYVQVNQDSDEEPQQIEAWNITNNTPQAIKVTSGKFTIQIPAQGSQYVPKTVDNKVKIEAEYNNQSREFTNRAANLTVNDSNGQLKLESN